MPVLKKAEEWLTIGRPAEAVRILTDHWDPDTADLRTTQIYVDALSYSGDHPQAIAVAGNAFERTENKDLLRVVARAYRLGGRDERAWQYYQRAQQNAALRACFYKFTRRR